MFCGRIESEFLVRRLAVEDIEVVDSGPEIEHMLDALRVRDLTGAWVALDGYQFGPEWQERLAEAGFRVLALDDGAKLPRYRAQVILAAEHDARPSGYPTPSSTVILAGPRYRLLRRDFADMARRRRESASGSVVLVSFGGADSRNATCLALTGLGQVLGAADRVLVVLGPLNPHQESIDGILGKVPFQHELHRAVADMRGLYHRADLAVSAAGGAAWELAVCGVPSILVPVAENQIPGMRYLTELGAALSVDDAPAMLGEEFSGLVGNLLADPEALREMARRGQAACDGRGASRVCRVLRCLDQTQESENFIVRPAEPADMEQVFRLCRRPRS